MMTVTYEICTGDDAVAIVDNRAIRGKVEAFSYSRLPGTRGAPKVGVSIRCATGDLHVVAPEAVNIIAPARGEA